MLILNAYSNICVSLYNASSQYSNSVFTYTIASPHNACPEGFPRTLFTCKSTHNARPEAFAGTVSSLVVVPTLHFLRVLLEHVHLY